MKQEEIMCLVSRIIEDTFMIDASDINRDTVAIDIPGWDSLSHVILLSNIEEEISGDLELAEANFKDVGDLVRFIEHQLSK